MLKRLLCCRRAYALTAALTALASLSVPIPCAAWGRIAHEMIIAAAIQALPEPLRADFQRRRLYFVEHSSDPDLLADLDPSERPHHFADVEAYDHFPFSRFRTQFIVQHRAPTTEELRNGDAMWQIESFTDRLAADFKNGNWNGAAHDAIFGAHYAADLTQPLHTTLNYDGQLSGQSGIHRRFETGVVEYFADQWTLRPAPAGFIPNLRARIFSEFFASYEARMAVFNADREARNKFRYADPRFMAQFARLVGPAAKARIEDAAGFTASLWYTAWIEGGRPDLRAWGKQ